MLKPGVTYKIKIAPELKSKSGVSFGKEKILTFTTAGAQTVSNTAGSKAGSSTVIILVPVIVVILAVVIVYIIRRNNKNK